MKKNLNLTKGLVFSQRVLLKLIEKGLTRKEAYDIVQRNALKTWESEKHFLEHLLEDEEVKKLVAEEELRELFDTSYYLRYVDRIFERFEKE